mgnify:CR=1 FL=1
MQRCLDLLLSSVALLFLLPLFFAIMLILSCTGEGEVFFRQQRVGKNGKTFCLIKFATMLRDSPSMTMGTITIKNDPRVLPFGKFLRSTKINELPQLINVLKGDMSLIGPRPQTERCFSAFTASAQKKILSVRPGLSGVGSIVFRGEQEMMNASNHPDKFYDEEIMPYKGLLECWYVEHKSIWLYIACIVLTIWVMIFPKSKLVWSVYKSLPKPNHKLASFIE